MKLDTIALKVHNLLEKIYVQLDTFVPQVRPHMKIQNASTVLGQIKKVSLLPKSVRNVLMVSCVTLLLIKYSTITILYQNAILLVLTPAISNPVEAAVAQFVLLASNVMMDIRLNLSHVRTEHIKTKKVKMIARSAKQIISVFSMNRVPRDKKNVKMDGSVQSKLFTMLTHVITDNTWTVPGTVSTVLLVTTVLVSDTKLPTVNLASLVTSVKKARNLDHLISHVIAIIKVMSALLVKNVLEVTLMGMIVVVEVLLISLASIVVWPVPLGMGVMMLLFSLLMVLVPKTNIVHVVDHQSSVVPVLSMMAMLAHQEVHAKNVLLDISVAKAQIL